MKTRDLIGPALDWAVAKCDGWFERNSYPHNEKLFIEQCNYSPSTDWAQGGPIIERECLGITYWGERSKFGQHEKREQFWQALHPTKRYQSRRVVGYGQTPLIAALRCYVASKVGNDVEIPEDLRNV